MNATDWRRRVLPVCVVVLVLWTVALVVDFVVFDGPTSLYQWVSVAVVYLMLAVLIAGELKARREGQ
jgi:prepilin signal peptidase PulO-like enzyme (type II secretory pathway)